MRSKAYGIFIGLLLSVPPVLLESVVIEWEEVLRALAGDGLDAEVFDAAGANPPHSAPVADVVDDPQPLDVFLVALADRTA